MRRSGKPNTSKCCDGQRKANYRIVPAEDLTPAPSGAMEAPSPDTSATNKKRLPMRKRGKVSDIELKHVPHVWNMLQLVRTGFSYPALLCEPAFSRLGCQPIRYILEACATRSRRSRGS